MRFLLRFISLLLLAGAVVAGVVDSIQSVASQSLVLTPLGVALESLRAGTVGLLQTYVSDHISASLWDTFLGRLIDQPAFALLLALSLLFYLAGHKRPETYRPFMGGKFST